MTDRNVKVVELRVGSWDLQTDRKFLVEATITTEEIRQKYNKCMDALKKTKSERPFHEELDFIVEYMEKEYGWIPVISDFIIHDTYETYEKIQNREFNKVYLEEKQ